MGGAGWVTQAYIGRDVGGGSQILWKTAPSTGSPRREETDWKQIGVGKVAWVGQQNDMRGQVPYPVMLWVGAGGGLF